MSRTILGIDLGEASVGTALVRIADDEELLGIEHFGARVFSPVTDSKTKLPLNRTRQAARGRRRGLQRTARRKAKLQNALVGAGLLPTDEALRDAYLGRKGDAGEVLRLNPYTLRARALAERLEPFEIGRVLTHLAERRGFRSNRKLRLAEILGPDAPLGRAPEVEEVLEDANKDEEGELKETYAQIRDIEADMKSRNADTLGELFATYLSVGLKVRGRRTSREMYIHEFDEIWRSQKRWHEEVLTDSLYVAVRMTFEQRPLRPLKCKKPHLQRTANAEANEAMERITKCCRRFPNRPVARSDHFYAHRFRIAQTLRNARIESPDGTMRELTDDEVNHFAELLQKQDKLNWAELRKAVGAQRSAKVNYERDPKTAKGLPGNKTEIFFKRVLGDKWEDGLFPSADRCNSQLEFMQDLETATDPKRLYENLQRPKSHADPIYPLTKEQAFEIASMAMSRRTVAYSARALRLLTAELLRGASSTHEALQKLDTAESRPALNLDYLPMPPFVPNPRVRRGLYEIRKVVNALIEKHGKPDEIRIELAREIKETEADRKRRNKSQKEKQDRNDRARAFYREHGIPEPTNEQILRHRLWVECRQECPYTGRSIACSDLLTERVEVEHILPLPRSGDDSFSNLTLTFREVNGEKGNRTPHEWLADPVHWREAHARFVRMRNQAKLRRFETEALDEDFTQRQLSDTRYVCRAAAEYLKCLGISVWVSNGMSTDILRRQWGLNGVVPVRPTKSANETKPGEKHRWDHRHHAVDAFIIALTTPKRYREAVMVKRGFLQRSEPPSPQIRAAVRALVDSTLTSHDVDKGIRGGLHDESFYGELRIGGEPIYVRRVAVDALVKGDFQKTMEFIETRVYDADLRERLMQHLRAHGDPKAAFPLGGLVLRDGGGRKMKVESVRIKHRVTENSARPIGGGRFAIPAGNHHAEIVRNSKGKFECRVVSMWDAAVRIRRDHQSPYGLTVGRGEELVMCLAENEVVEYNERAMRVVAVSRNDLRLRDVNDARPANELEGARLRSSDEYAAIHRKVRISPLGGVLAIDEP